MATNLPSRWGPSYDTAKEGTLQEKSRMNASCIYYGTHHVPSVLFVYHSYVVPFNITVELWLSRTKWCANKAPKWSPPQWIHKRMWGRVSEVTWARFKIPLLLVLLPPHAQPPGASISPSMTSSSLKLLSDPPRSATGMSYCIEGHAPKAAKAKPPGETPAWLPLFAWFSKRLQHALCPQPWTGIDGTPLN